MTKESARFGAIEEDWADFFDLVGVVCCKISGAEDSECRLLLELEVLASRAGARVGFKVKST